jgi:membrane dipeptidase
LSFHFDILYYSLYIFLMATMNEKRNDERTPLTHERPRGLRQNVSSLTGLLLIFIAAVTYGSYFYGVPGHAVKSQAEVILAENPLIDGHNDLLILVRALYDNKINGENFTKAFEKGGLAGHVDVPRLKQGQQGGAFWSAFVPCPANGLDFSDAAYAPYVRATLEQIDLFQRLSEKYPDYFTLSRSAKEAEQAFADGKLISPLAIEGLHQIGNSLATLRLYHSLGVRYSTLTWNCHNKYADAAAVTIDGKFQASKPYHGGVSKAGQQLILEMNRLGMLVDLSHVSVDTMRDVLGGSPEKGWKGSIASPIFSHSSAKAICPHPRNVPDDILQLVKKRNGLVMVNFSPDFISCKDVGDESGLPEYVKEDNNLEQVVKHITYIGEMIGYDHVGLGTDYDGIEDTPRGLEDVSKFPDLVTALLEKGVSAKDAAKIVGRNLLRVWHEADRVAAKLQKEIEPVEETLGRIEWDD